MGEPATPEPRRCRQCGGSWESAADGGFCPACLIEDAAGADWFAGSGDGPVGGGGSRLGGFELLERMGEGASAVVFRARQFDPPRLVALKVMRSGQFASEAERQRFRLEAEAARVLTHPNIVSLYAADVLDGWPCLALELIEGRSLACRLESGAPGLPPREGVRLMVKVARAVHVAHQHGLLHRDLKPGNILLDADGEPHLADFGAARWMDRDPSHPPSLGYVGTPGYMAPELAGGGATAATVASDVYSLGAVLFEVLTGRPPFQEPTPEAFLEAVRISAPPRLRKVGGPADADLETICLRCLDRDPDHRYASAAALADDLDRWLAFRPVLARRATPVERLVKWARRNPVVAGLSLLLAGSLLGGLALATYQYWLNRELLAAATAANARLTESLDRNRLREAEQQLAGTSKTEAIMTLASVLRDRPSNRVAAARLLSTLAQTSLPWPVLPPLRHDGPVRQGVVSLDSEWLLTGAADGWLHIWSRTSGIERLRLPHQADRGEFRLHPAGDQAATLLPSGGLAMWDVRSGEKLWEARCEPAPGARMERPVPGFSSLRFGTAHDWLLAGDNQGMMSLWTARQGQCLVRVELGEPVRETAFAKDAPLLAGASDRTVRVWRWSVEKSGAPGGEVGLDELPALRREALSLPVASLELNAAGSRLLVAWGPYVEVTEVPSGRRLCRFQHGADVRDACFSPDGRRVAAANAGNRIHFYELDAQPPSEARSDLRSPITCVTFSDDGQLLAAGTEGGEARVFAWTTRPGLALQPALHVAPVLGVAISPGGRRLLTVLADGTARCWALDRHDRVIETLLPGAEAAGCEYSPRGGWTAARDHDGGWHLTNPERPGFQPVPLAFAQPIAGAVFSPDGRWLMVLGNQGRRGLLETETGRWRLPDAGDGTPGSGVSWSADGRRAGWPATNEVVIWSAADGWSNPPLRLPRNGVTMLELSPDGRYAALADERPRLELWELGTAPRELAALELPGPARVVRFSGDGGQVGVGAGPNAARVWAVPGGQPLTPPLHPGADVTALAFSPDGRQLVAGGSQGQVQLWRIPGGEALVDLGRRSVRPVVSAEFSPDGEWVLLLSSERRLRLMHATSGLTGWAPDPLPVGTSVRFGGDGSRVLVSGPVPGAQRMLNPAHAPPPAELLVLLAEVAMGRRLTENGGWVDLDGAGWESRFARLTSTPGWTRFGPPKPVRVAR